MSLLSPGVEVIERDADLRIETVTSSTGAVVVAATRGPVNTIVDVTSPSDYIDTFGPPDDVNYKFAWTALKFAEGSNALKVVRIEDSTRNCAGSVVGFTAPTTSQAAYITSQNEPMKVEQYPLTYDSVLSANTTGGLLDTSGAEKLFHIYSVGPGPYYEDVSFSIVCGTDYTNLQNFKRDLAQAVLEEDKQEVISTYWSTLPSALRGDVITSQPRNPDGSVQTANASSGWAIDSNMLGIYTAPEYGPSPTVTGYDASGNAINFYDEYLLFVFDANGQIDNTYLLSTTPDKLDGFGSNMFGPTVVNGDNNVGGNKYIRIFSASSEQGSKATEVTWSMGRTYLGGADGLSGYTTANSDNPSSHDGVLDPDPSLADLEGELFLAWQKYFGNKDAVQVDLLLDCDYSNNVKREMDNLAKNIRKDCMAILNVPESVMVNTTTKKVVDQVYTAMGNYTDSTLNVNSSYSAIYGNYFKIYDPYTEKNRWVPVTGFIGATIARVDFAYAQWWAPAGLNRGVIDNVIDVAVNPNQAQRDIIYVKRINPIVSMIGQGIVIWGQKTLQAKPSAFDRINVRRLFLYLERSIERVARYFIFELNDEYTRSRFSNIVNNFLSEIKTKRGVYDYEVVADETNNTADVIDRNEFVAEILIKPVRVIEFIKLIFTAVGTGVNFTELVGRG
jgi:hypothetical protein